MPAKLVECHAKNAALGRAFRLAPVFIADFFFMWMYFGSKALERTLEPAGAGAAHAAEWGYLWRHGMTAGWPLYIPGFFAVGFAIAFWSRGRPLRNVVLGRVAILLSATIVAWPVGAVSREVMARSFEVYSGNDLDQSLLLPPVLSGAIGCLTNLCWSMLVISAQAAISSRSFLPLVVPFCLYAGLAIVRPGDFGELTNPWIDGLGDRDPAAIVSTALLLVLAFVIAWLSRPATTGARSLPVGLPTPH